MLHVCIGGVRHGQLRSDLACGREIPLGLAGLSQSRAIVVPDVLRGFDHQALAAELAHDLDHLDTVIVLGEARNGHIALGPLLEPAADRSRVRFKRTQA